MTGGRFHLFESLSQRRVRARTEHPPGNRRVGLARSTAAACVVWILGMSPVSGAAGVDSFRMAFTRATFTGINENDARATLKALGTAAARDLGVPVEPQVSMYEGERDLGEALAAKNVDAVAIPMTEFPAVRRHLRPSTVLLATLANQEWDHYLVLVRGDKGYHGLADLQGRRLGIHSGLRACLAEPWLEVSLNDARLPRGASFFEHIERESKLTRAVLPVFFGKLDACLVTRSGFEAMKELNPQLGRQLTTLLKSEPVVTMVLAFRADYEPPYFAKLEQALASMHESAAGRQMLTIFQIERLEVRPLTAIEPSLELLRRHGAIGSGGAPGPAKDGQP